MKIRKFYADADILSAPTFWTFSAWQTGTASRYGTGERPPIKAGGLRSTPHLTTACGESNNTIREMWEIQVDYSERRRRTSAGPERSQQL
jgi:hypothetical protein